MRDQIIATAREYIGVPYLHQGRSALGLDCLGLIVVVAKRTGALPLDYEAPADYPENPSSERLLRELSAECPPVPYKGPRPGDVLVLRLVRTPQHLAFFSGSGLIHTHPQLRVVKESAWHDWAGRVTSVHQFPAVLEACANG